LGVRGVSRGGFAGAFVAGGVAGGLVAGGALTAGVSGVTSGGTSTMGATGVTELVWGGAAATTDSVLNGS
jgi:hypothetical protein